MRIKEVGAEDIRSLRHRVLRKGKPYSTTSYNKDNNKKTIHLGVIKSEKIITCATFYPEPTELVKYTPFFTCAAISRKYACLSSP